FLAQRVDIDVVGRLRWPALVPVHRHASGDSLPESCWGSPVPMYFDNWWCRLTVLRSRYGLGLVPRKPSDFMPRCTAAMLEKSCGKPDRHLGSPTGVYSHSVCGSWPFGKSSNTDTSKMHLSGL